MPKKGAATAAVSLKSSRSVGATKRKKHSWVTQNRKFGSKYLSDTPPDDKSCLTSI